MLVSNELVNLQRLLKRVKLRLFEFLSLSIVHIHFVHQRSRAVLLDRCRIPYIERAVSMTRIVSDIMITEWCTRPFLRVGYERAALLLNSPPGWNCSCLDTYYAAFWNPHRQALSHPATASAGVMILRRRIGKITRLKRACCVFYIKNSLIGEHRTAAFSRPVDPGIT